MFNKIVYRVLTVIAITSLSFTKTESVRANELYGGDCPDAPARLNQGDIAVISDEAGTKGLNLRVQPGIKNDIIMSIPLYAYVTIIAGPKCNDGYRWYEVGYNGQDGWSAEVGQDGIYNLVPNGQPMPETIETPGGQSENSQQASRPDVYPDSFLGTWVNNKAWCIDSQKGFNCSVEVEITRQPDGKQTILLKIDSKVINSSSEQGIYQQFCMVDSCWWTYVFLLDGIEAYVNPTDEGKLSFGYHKPDIGVGTTLTLVDKPVMNETQVPNQSQPAPLVEAPVEAPETDSNWFCKNLGMFCPVLAAELVNTSCTYQCVTFARQKRPDLDVWAKNAGTSDKILALAQKMSSFPYQGQQMQVRVRGLDETPKVGDLVVWQSGCGGAWSGGGHIGLNSTDGKLIITDSNWSYQPGNKCSTRNDVQIPILSCMRFITNPYPFMQPDVSTPNTDTPSGTPTNDFIEWLKKLFGG